VHLSTEPVATRPTIFINGDSRDNFPRRIVQRVIILSERVRRIAHIVADEGATTPILRPIRAGAMNQLPSEKHGRATWHLDRNRFHLTREWIAMPDMGCPPISRRTLENLAERHIQFHSHMGTILKLRNGRGDRIRTCDLVVPNHALYQAKLRPDN